MAENTSLEGRAIDILRLNNANLKWWSERAAFIQQYREFLFDDTYPEVHASRFVDNTGLSRLMDLLELDADQVDSLAKMLFKEKSKEELNEVYDFLVNAVVQERKNADATMYYYLSEAYVSIIREFAKFTTTVGILLREVLPEIGKNGYIEGRDVEVIIDRAKRREKAYEWGDVVFERKIEKDGVTKEEIMDYSREVDRKEEYRGQLHKELVQYGARIGLSDLDVMADIIFRRYNCSEARILVDKRELVIIGGTLVFRAYHEEKRKTMLAKTEISTLVPIPEGDFKEPDDKKSNAYKRYQERLRMANAIFEKHKAGDPRYKGGYKSCIGGRSKNDDIKTFERIMKENPALPASYEFEPTDVMHATLDYILVLKMDLSSFYKEGVDTQQELEKFVEYLNKAVPTAMFRR